MNRKTTTLGLGAALIGVATALVGAVLAGKAPAKGAAPTPPRPTPQPGADTALALPAAPASVADSDGPSGPTAPTQPAPTGDEGHAAPDLAAGTDVGPDHRAPEAFRPDMDAPMTEAEREALRPATGPSPSLVSDEGGTTQGVGGDR